VGQVVADHIDSVILQRHVVRCGGDGKKSWVCMPCKSGTSDSIHRRGLQNVMFDGVANTHTSRVTRQYQSFNVLNLYEK
jgi:hypothetical protein